MYEEVLKRYARTDYFGFYTHLPETSKLAAMECFLNLEGITNESELDYQILSERTLTDYIAAQNIKLMRTQHF